MLPELPERSGPQRPLLTALEVATWINVSLRTLNEIVADGGLVPIRVRGRLRRFDPTQVEAYLRRRSKNC